MADDREHPVWVLALIGVAASALSAPGQFRPTDWIIGFSLSLILITVPRVWTASRLYRIAYSGVAGLCGVLVTGVPLNALFVRCGISELRAWTITSNNSGESYDFLWMEVAIVTIWIVVGVVVFAILARQARLQRHHSEENAD